jgi:putative endonuclease
MSGIPSLNKSSSLSGETALFRFVVEARVIIETLMPYAIYILRCSDGTYYTGLTKDLDGRIYEHQSGANQEAYTFRRRPVKLVWHVVTESYQEAFQWEHRIKGWSRAKKEALIRGDVDGIREIVKSERKQREHTKKKLSR